MRLINNLYFNDLTRIIVVCNMIEAMKRELMDILACPICKGRLQLSTEEENDTEIVTASLYCQKCDEHYPIVDTIPNLLPPNQRG